MQQSLRPFCEAVTSRGLADARLFRCASTRLLAVERRRVDDSRTARRRASTRARARASLFGDAVDGRGCSAWRQHCETSGEMPHIVDARVGRGFACFAVEEAKAYPRAMSSDLGAAIDARLEKVIVAWGRRRWPALRLVPARWIRPVVAPTALRFRRMLSRAVLAAAMPIGLILALLILKP
jgi:hypothetical protein